MNTIIAALPPSQLHLSTPVTSLTTVLPPELAAGSGHAVSPKVTLTTADGQSATYDHVILACHSDAALSILRAGGKEGGAGGGITHDEERILGKFRWNKNVAVLHSDVRV